jgi:hypothetical protein
LLRGGGNERTALGGIAAHAPYIELPPAGWHDGDEAASLIIAWHLNDRLDERRRSWSQVHEHLDRLPQNRRLRAVT